MLDWFHTKLRNKIFVFVCTIILFLLAITLIVIHFNIVRQIRAKIKKEISYTQKFYKALETKNFRELGLLGTSLTESSSLEELLRKENVGTLRNYLSRYQASTGLDFMLVMDVAESKVVQTVPTSKAETDRLLSSTAISHALQTGRRYKDYWSVGKNLYQIVAVPLCRSDYCVGVVVSGFRINDDLARELEPILGAEITFLAGKVAPSTTLLEKESGKEGRDEPALRDLLGFYLSHEKDIEKRVRSQFLTDPSGGKDDAVLDVRLKGKTYLSQFAPLIGDGDLQGIYVVQESLDEALAFMKGIRNLLLGIGIFVMFLALFFGFLLSDNVTAPIETLERGMKKVAEGILDEEVQIRLKDEIGRLAQTFNQMLVGLRHKEQLKRYVSRSAWRTVEASKDGRVSLGGAREEVTVLFSDIRGFTTLSEKLNPEDVIELMNDYLKFMNCVIFEHGGDIDKFVGDAIMAVFYTDESDSAQKAVIAAYTMQAELAGFNQMRQAQGKEEIKVGIGINTGIVVEGNVGTEDRLEHTVLGDTVNLASRLESLSKQAKYKGIMMSGNTYERVKELVDAEFVDSVTVKGKTVPVRVYELKEIRSTSKVAALQEMLLSRRTDRFGFAG